jgi:DNA-binding XRE family transcriptional regulator
MEQKDKVAAAGLTAGSAKAPGPVPHVPSADVASDIPQQRAASDGDARVHSNQPSPVSSERSRRAPDSGDAAASEPKATQRPNNVRRIRIEHMMSKAELARRANLSVLTIDRVERGYGCRMDTKRKILEALGLSLAERVRVFGEEE